MIKTAVDSLAETAPVDIVIVPGNHDRQTMYYLGEALEDWYWQDERVSVDNGPALRKYYQHGQNLIGLTHGDGLRPDKLPLLMATEAQQAWAATRWREWHIGHYHTKREFRYLPVDEHNGVRVRVIPSLCAADRWHYEKGFVQGVRAAEAYVWHPTMGNVARYSANVTAVDGVGESGESSPD
jgi:hypothetical protein